MFQILKHSPGIGLALLSALAAHSHSKTLSGRVLQIAIADGAIDDFSGNALVSLTYSQAQSVLPDIAGIPWRNLHLYTGPADTLDQNAPTGDPVPHRLREIPFAVFDDGDGIFDEQDSLVFWGQGVSRWRRQPSGSPEAYHFVTNVFATQRQYYLDLGATHARTLEREGFGDADPIASKWPKRSFSKGWTYARAQRDRVSCFCDETNRVDSAAGYTWYWFWRSDCASNPKPIEITPAQWAVPHLQNLRQALSDSLYMVLDFPHPPSGTLQADGIQIKSAEGIWHPASQNPHYRHDHHGYVRFALDLSGQPAAVRDPVETGPALDRPWNPSLVWGGSLPGLAGYTVRYRQDASRLKPPFQLFPGAEWDSLATDSLLASFSLPAAVGGFVVHVREGIGLGWRQVPATGEVAWPLNPNEDCFFAVTSGIRPLQRQQMKPLSVAREGLIADLETGDQIHPDYLIISPLSLSASAMELAEYRRSEKGGKHAVAVVSWEVVQALYSGGNPEPAALRDFLHWADLKWGMPQQALPSVLLFGDGHFDVRDLSKRQGDSRSSFVPPFIFHTGPSHNLTSETRFTVFQEGSGAMAIGRLPITSDAEGREYVRKAIDYDHPQNGGAWRGRLLWVADDAFQHGHAGGDLETGMNHTGDVESVFRSVRDASPLWRHSKLLLADYSMNPAFRKPLAAQDLVDQINQGALLITYFGHGAYNQWSDEVLAYTHETLPRLRNATRLPVVNSFSCTVGRFENGKDDVWTESLVRKPVNGAIAGVAATRETHPGQNVKLATHFYADLLRPDSLGGGLTLGESLRRAQNQSGPSLYSDAAAYALLGEPVIRVSWGDVGLKLPDTLGQALDTLSALQCGSIQGRTFTLSGSQAGIEGHAQVTLVSSPLTKEWVYPYQQEIDGSFSREVRLAAELPGKVLYSGGAPVHEGRFKLDFVLPLQMPYGDSAASILVQVFDTVQARMGGVVLPRIRLEGVARNQACAIEDDGKGPRMALLSCDDREMTQGDLPSPFDITLPYCLRLRVNDSIGGLQTSLLPDEGTTVSVPGAVEPFHPNPGIDEPYRKEFRITFNPAQLKTGTHPFVATASDAYGNRTQRTWMMRVRRDTVAAILTAYNVPNPMKRKGTTFYFAASVPADDGEYAVPAENIRMRYTLRIYNQAGRLVRLQSGLEHPQWTWAGDDAFGRKLANGVYFYTVTGLWDAGLGDAPRQLSGKRNVLVISR